MAFDAFHLDPVLRVLTRNGEPLCLPPQIFDLLLYFLENPDRLLTKDELLRAIWPDRIASEGSLSQAIFTLRKAIQDGQAARRFIVTSPRRGYRFACAVLAEDNRPATEASTAVAADVPDVRTEPLLAVLAFDNLSGDPEMAYFSDGVSEEILDAVARGSGLRVIGRASSFQFRGADKAAANVARALRATHTLDGSVRRSGSRMRIAARLVDCASETTIWSDRYDRELSDVFALQDEIAAAVAASLKAEFSRSGHLPGKFDPAAYDLYLCARYGAGAGAIGMMERCVALERNFAPAWALLAMMRTNQAKFEHTDLAFEPLVASARAAVATAERLDPTMGFTRTVRAWLEPTAAYQRREDLMSEALRLTPGDPNCLNYMCALLGTVGRCREALALAEQGTSLDPMLPTVAALRARSLAENYAEQTARFEAMRAKWPALFDSSVVAAVFAAANADWPRYDTLQRHAYAQAFAEQAGARAVMRSTFRYWDAMRDGDRAFLDELPIRLLEDVERTGSAPLQLLWSAAAAGHVDAAYEAVERASFDEAFDLERQSLMVDWWPPAIFARCLSSALIDDPRFLRLCGKLGLVHYWLATGRWPDCADQVRYDFHAEARKVATEGLARHI